MNKLITTIACLICCIVYTQAQNKDNMLSKKEQSIAAISMYAARGNQDSLKVILARGLDCGLTVSERSTYPALCLLRLSTQHGCIGYADESHQRACSTRHKG